LEQSIYLYRRKNIQIILPIFVDDLTLALSDLPALNSFVKELATHFELRDLGETKVLLGIEIERNHKCCTITLSQRHYIEDVLKRYNMSDCNPVLTPMDPNSPLSKTQGPTIAQGIYE
jgi:hypothetical protein